MRVNYRTGEREKRGHATEDSFAWGGSLFSKKFYLTQEKKEAKASSSSSNVGIPDRP
jgi:hypothetical protein